MKMVVVGINGMLGHKFAEIASKDFRVVGTYTKFLSKRNFPTERLDILNKKSVDQLVEKIRPDMIVNCAAITDVDFCEDNPEIAEAVNVDGTKNLVDAARNVGAQFVYFSTDSVFDGKKGNYTEESTPNPINVYSKTKLEGEKLVSEKDILIRTTMYGWNILEKKSLVEWVIEELSNGRRIDAYGDNYFTPIYTGTISCIVVEMFKRKMKGLYHIPGREKLSKYTFAKKVARVFGLDENLINNVSIDSAIKKTKRPKDLSLSSVKIRGEGFRLNDVEDDLKIMKKERVVENVV